MNEGSTAVAERRGPRAGAPGEPEDETGAIRPDPEPSGPSEPAASGERAPESADARAGAELGDEELVQAVAALVFASPDPLGAGRLATLLGTGAARVERALEECGARLSRSGLPLELRQIAGGWQVLTARGAADVVALLFKDRRVDRVTPAALETLAVVAYRQPVTKAEIEAIRGVQVGPVLRMLVDRGLLRVTGRADQPGHPLQYGTTRLFLERFGLASIGELPRDGELARE
jgi:segregation and condensation protein B